MLLGIARRSLKAARQTNHRGLKCHVNWKTRAVGITGQSCRGLKEQSEMRRIRLDLGVFATMLGLVMWAILAGSIASAAVLVVPNNLAATEGNTNNVYPFNIDSFPSTQRYQQVFAGSAFASVSGPQLITQIAFRPDGPNGFPFSSTIANIQFNLSTTNAAIDGLSLIFADNVGSDDTVVFSGSLSLSSADTGPPEGPKAFDIVINLQVPFLYDPSAGNLLLDVRNISGGNTTTFDAEVTSGDPVSRTSTFFGNVNSPTADFADTLGLVTQFTITPAPAVVPVVVDIKPGSEPAPINPKSQGVIPVAILTTDTFDATTVNPATARFGKTGTEAMLVQSALEDVDGDGDTDLILHFNTQDTGIQCGDTSASLTGETFSGQAIQGSDSIVTVGCR
jgi:hypothetical protein